jgi:hypothetical protein
MRDLERLEEALGQKSLVNDHLPLLHSPSCVLLCCCASCCYCCSCAVATVAAAAGIPAAVKGWLSRLRALQQLDQNDPMVSHQKPLAHPEKNVQCTLSL